MRTYKSKLSEGERDDILRRKEAARIGSCYDVIHACNRYLADRGIKQGGLRELITQSVAERKRQKALRLERWVTKIENAALEIEAAQR